MTTWLVTGAFGFIGRHVGDAIREIEPGARVLRLGRRARSGCSDKDDLVADLELPGPWVERVRSLGASFVVHAAGLTPPAPPDRLHRANTAATSHLLDSLRAAGQPTRVVLVGSAAELGPVPASRLPADETCPCRPVEAYGLSKWAATRLGLDANGRDGLELMIARPFNPIGPGQPSTQAFGRLAERLRQARDGDRISVGDVTTKRDFIDVRDVARALVALARAGRSGRIYHVGTGESRSVSEGFARLVELSGRRVVLEPAAVHSVWSDSRAAIGRILAETDWRPRIPFEKSLADLWDARNSAETSRHVA